MKWVDDFLAAVQFLTRLPVPHVRFDPDSLSRAAKFFPIVGLVIGIGASVVQHLAAPHLSRPLVALSVLIFLVVVTGGLHEDGLADAADGFGGGWDREGVLKILRDSRIGSYGALAITFSVLARLLLLTSLPINRFSAFVISAHVLCRWTTLPLSYCLPPARGNDGQGARIAHRVSFVSLLIGTLLTLATVVYVMGRDFWIPALVSAVIVVVSGLYYFHRINGVTGDCFGATNQLAEIAVYACGVWNL